MVSYTIHPIIPCDAQFWIMSVYLPFGIALLQAANSQFLYVAGQQRKYASVTNLDELEFSEKSAPINQSSPRWKQSIQRIQRADKITRTVIYIGIGMAVEVACITPMAGGFISSTNGASKFYHFSTYVQETLDAIASWERKNRGNDVSVDAISASTALGGSTLGGSSGKSVKTKASAKSGDSRRSDMFTMLALENALRNNPRPLLEFAALKDFSGENISFLSHVTDWKRTWVTSSLDPKTLQYEQFIQAVRIYSHFISLEYSQFPINISSRLKKELSQVFDEAANTLNRRNSSQSSASATPFDDFGSEASMTPLRDTFDLEGTLGKANLQSVTTMADLAGDDRTVIVPEIFSPLVFDPAEGEIKYLVLTNTWPKFVHHGLDNNSQKNAEDGEGHFFNGFRNYLCGMERSRWR
ncbi:putative gpcr -type protein [Eutypa lata UCREL1]|uniref:Putative gpcr-type protein n=1 Tax=Eutypa lata (strain UCR-EL1) TaxID=1287681 RepID=M7S7F5_EUTLA|nr:putative gpcr -type protein [Eutypa lata UCREL1]